MNKLSGSHDQHWRFPDGNEIAFSGSPVFRQHVLETIWPIIEKYTAVYHLNHEPMNVSLFEAEIALARRATEKNEPFNGEYITFTPTEAECATV